MLASCFENGQVVSGIEMPEIIETAYTVPGSNVYFVDSVLGSDANAGTSIGAPWLTLNKALTTAIGTNKTVVVRGAVPGTYTRNGLAGNYREIIASTVTTTRNGITIQAYPGEEVWVKGSIVATGWTPGVGYWSKTGYAPTFTRGQGTSATQGVICEEPDQVFINGVPLTQVTTLGAVTTGTFFVNTGTSTIYIGTDPATGVVEISDKRKFVQISADDATVQGIGFEHWGLEFDGTGGACIVGMSGHNPHVENCTFAWTHGGQAISFSQGVGEATPRANGCLFIHMGQNAGHSYQVQQLIVENNRFTDINRTEFDGGGVLGVWKVTGVEDHVSLYTSASRTSDDPIFRCNVVEDAFCNGFWLDASVFAAIVVNNRFIRVGRGLGTGGLTFFEISADMVFANNLMIDCEAVMISAADETHVWHNSFAYTTATVIANTARPAVGEHYDDAMVRYYQDQMRERQTGFTQNGHVLDRITKLNNLYNNVFHTADDLDTSPINAIIRQFKSNDAVVISKNVTADVSPAATFTVATSGHTFTGTVDLSANAPESNIDITTVGTLVVSDGTNHYGITGTNIPVSTIIDHVTTVYGQVMIANQDYNFYCRAHATTKPLVFS